METPQDRLNNLMMFLLEIANGEYNQASFKELKAQAGYHTATMELLIDQRIKEDSNVI
jgi:hypothetical protein